MDIDKLKTFYQVASVGSISKATRSLHIDKSSISRQLSLFEEQLGKKLFERQHQKLVLTTHGQFLFKKASSILMEIEATKQALLTDEHQISSLTISTTFALASTWLTHFLHKFINTHPNLTLHLKAANQPLNLSLREADVAIRPFSSDSENLIQRHLRPWTLRMYASKKYIETFGMPKNCDELENHRLILLGDSPNVYPHPYTNWPLSIGAKNGRFRKPFLVINSLEGMYNLVANGVGIGNFADDSPLFRQGGQLIPILHNDISYTIDVYYTYPKQFENLAPIKLLEKFLLEEIDASRVLNNRIL